MLSGDDSNLREEFYIGVIGKDAEMKMCGNWYHHSAIAMK